MKLKADYTVTGRERERDREIVTSDTPHLTVGHLQFGSELFSQGVQLLP